MRKRQSLARRSAKGRSGYQSEEQRRSEAEGEPTPLERNDAPIRARIRRSRALEADELAGDTVLGGEADELPGDTVLGGEADELPGDTVLGGEADELPGDTVLGGEAGELPGDMVLGGETGAGAGAVEGQSVLLWLIISSVRPNAPIPKATAITPNPSNVDSSGA